MPTTEKWAKVFKTWHQYQDSIPIHFGDAKDAKVQWDGTNLQILPVTDDTGAFHVGDGTTDMDFKVFLGASGVYALFDVGNSRFSLVGVDMATDAAVSITDTTESTSTTTGALVVSGGIGFAKDMYVGDDVFLTSAAKLDWAAGNVTLTHSTGALACTGALTVSIATESTSTTTGALIVTGGIGFGGDMYVGDDVFLTSAAKLDWAAGNVTLTHSTGKLTNSGTLTNTGAVNIDDTTESTSTTTGSLQTDGGLACAKDFYAGDDIFLTSGAVLNWNAGNVTLTHSAGLLTLAGGQFYIAGGVSIVGIKLGTLSSTTPGSGLTVDATTTRGLEVNVDDNNTARATGTQGRAIFGRTMIYADNECEDWGVHGLSKISGVAKTGNVSAGVTGAFESTGTCSIATGAGNSFFAGVMGRVGGGGTFTITSGNVVGVLSFYNTTTANAFTGTGTAAFMATASDIAGMGNWDYGLYIEDTVYGIYCGAEPTAAGRIAKFFATIDAANLTDGYGAFEVDLTLTGTQAGHNAASSSWVNITAGTASAGNYVCARNDGVYEASAATITNAKIIFGARMHKLLDDTDALSFPFSINTNNTAITALIDVNNLTDLGTVANAGATAATLLPICRDAGGTLKYVLLYDLA